MADEHAVGDNCDAVQDRGGEKAESVRLSCAGRRLGGRGEAGQRRETRAFDDLVEDVETGIILWDEVLQLEDQPAQVADHAESPKSAEARLGGHCRLHEFRAICIECKDCGLGGAIRATATGL